MITRRKFLKSVAASGLFVPAFPGIVRAQLSRSLPFLASASAAACAFATAWAARVVANGGASPSIETQTSICTFQDYLIANSLDTQMIAWNAVVPDNLIAARTPQLVGGGNDPWTDGALALVNSDLTVNGIRVSAPGAASGMFTNLNPTTIYASDGDAGLTFYSSVTASDAAFVMGTGRIAGVSLSIFQDFPGFGFFFECFDQNGACPGRVTNAGLGVFNGYYSNNRTSTSDSASYGANSVTPHFAIGSCNTLNATTRPNGQIGCLQAGNGGGASFSRCSFFATHHGLSSAQSALFYPGIQQLRTDLGGGYV